MIDARTGSRWTNRVIPAVLRQSMLREPIAATLAYDFEPDVQHTAELQQTAEAAQDAKALRGAHCRATLSR